MERRYDSINVYGIADESIVDGPGIRMTVFAQGCNRACPGCHNADSQPFEENLWVDVDGIVERFSRNKLLRGITFSGGEPFAQAGAFAELARRVKALGKDVWVYSGFTYEELVEIAGGRVPEMRGSEHLVPEDVSDLLEEVDVLVDGPYVEALHDVDLEWRGSSNQRIIDLTVAGNIG